MAIKTWNIALKPLIFLRATGFKGGDLLREPSWLLDKSIGADAVQPDAKDISIPQLVWHPRSLDRWFGTGAVSAPF